MRNDWVIESADAREGRAPARPCGTAVTTERADAQERVPPGWEIRKLGVMASIARGGSPRPIEKYLTSAIDGINWIKIGDVGVDAKYITRTAEKIIQEGVEMSRRVAVGDFLLSNSMSFGRPYILQVDGCIHDGWLTIQKYSDCFDREFLYYILSSKFVTDQYESLASGSSVKNLNKEIVENIAVPVPPLAEQKRIAEVLGDTDALIANLEKRIAKRKLVKQGMMQRLMRNADGGMPDAQNMGGTRSCASVLDGGCACGCADAQERVPPGWETRRIDQLGQIVTGSTPPRDDKTNWNGTFPWISARDFHSVYIDKTEEHISEEGKKYCRCLPENSVLITCIASIGLNAITRVKCATNQQINAVICRQNVVPEWLYYAMNHRGDAFRSLAGQTAVPIISKSLFASFQLPVPPLAEQKRIAEVLGDMDAEIDALERKVEKYRQIKRGMMSELLSGKVRLKEAGE